MIHVIPVTQARKNFLTLVDKIDEEYGRIDVTKNGTIKATIVSPDYLDAMEETIFTLKYSMRKIKKAKQEIARGNYVTLNTFLKEFDAGKTLSSSRKRSKRRA